MAQRQIQTQLRHTANDVALLDIRLGKLAAERIVSDNWPGVRRYLRRRLDTAAMLTTICKQVRKEFGANAELSLEVYRDPEINDRYLSLCIRLAHYGPDMMERIEKVSQSFESRISPSRGYVLLTTDFRPARVINVV